VQRWRPGALLSGRLPPCSVSPLRGHRHRVLVGRVARRIPSPDTARPCGPFSPNLPTGSGTESRRVHASIPFGERQLPSQ